MAIGDYPKYREVTLQSANVDANVTDFPALLVITDVEAIAAADCASKRYQIFDHNDTELPYEEEYYAEGTYVNAYIWVKVPTWYASPTGSQNNVKFCYDYDPGSDQDDPDNVRDANFVVVSHLGDSAGSAADVTGNGYTGTYGGNLPDQTTGPYYKAQELDGTGDYVNYTDQAAFDGMATLTVEVWGKGGSRSDANEDTLVSKWGTDFAHLLRYDSANNALDFYVRNASHTIDSAINNVSVEDSAWHHFAGVYDGSDLIAYLDGTALGTTGSLTGNVDAATAQMWVGRSPASGSDDWTGDLAEFRLSNTGRSAAWLKITHANINEADHEQSWSGELTPGASFVPYPYPLHNLTGGLSA